MTTRSRRNHQPRSGSDPRRALQATIARARARIAEGRERFDVLERCASEHDEKASQCRREAAEVAQLLDELERQANELERRV